MLVLTHDWPRLSRRSHNVQNYSSRTQAPAWSTPCTPTPDIMESAFHFTKWAEQRTNQVRTKRRADPRCRRGLSPEQQPPRHPGTQVQEGKVGASHCLSFRNINLRPLIHSTGIHPVPGSVLVTNCPGARGLVMKEPVMSRPHRAHHIYLYTWMNSTCPWHVGLPLPLKD